jgi:hypothetical protein
MTHLNRRVRLIPITYILASGGVLAYSWVLMPGGVPVRNNNPSKMAEHCSSFLSGRARRGSPENDE